MQTNNTITNYLDTNQLEAASHLSGIALLQGKSGTGKTVVVAHRIANLINSGHAKGENILLITSSMKSVQALRKEISRLCFHQNQVESLHIHTFNSFGWYILKQYYSKLGRQEKFLLIDEKDKLQILMEQTGCDKFSAQHILGGISRIKRRFKYLHRIKNHNLVDNYYQYEKILRQHNLFDSDDLVYYPLWIFKYYPRLLTSFRQQFEFLLVDDCQYIGHANYQLIKKLKPAKAAENLFISGNIEHCTTKNSFYKKFELDYPDTKVYELFINHRSTPNIQKAAHLILNSEVPYHLEENEEKITVATCENQLAEAEYIAKTILTKMITENNDNRFAIFYRSKSQLLMYEKILEEYDIDYQIVYTKSDFAVEPIKTLITLLQNQFNPNNEFVNHILNEKNLLQVPQWIEFDDFEKSKKVRETIVKIIDNYFEEEKTEYWRTFHQLLNLADDFGENLEDFLIFATGGSNFDLICNKSNNVLLMPIHTAKETEAEYVFITECEQDCPNAMEKMKGERNMIHSAMMRTKKQLFFTYAEKRYFKDRELIRFPHQFLNTISEDLKETIQIGSSKDLENQDIRQMFLF